MYGHGDLDWFEKQSREMQAKLLANENIRRDPEGKNFNPDADKKGRRKGVLLGEGFKLLESQAGKIKGR